MQSILWKLREPWQTCYCASESIAAGMATYKVFDDPVKLSALVGSHAFLPLCCARTATLMSTVRCAALLQAERLKPAGLSIAFGSSFCRWHAVHLIAQKIMRGGERVPNEEDWHCAHPGPQNWLLSLAHPCRTRPLQFVLQTKVNLIFLS